MKSITDIFETLVIKTKKILWRLGLRAFAIILALIFVDIIVGGLVFYKYVFLAENQAPETSGNVIKFDVKIYQNVLNHLPAEEPDAPGSVE